MGMWRRLATREDDDQQKHEGRNAREDDKRVAGRSQCDRRTWRILAGYRQRCNDGMSCGKDFGGHEDEPERERCLAGRWRFAGVGIVDVGCGNTGVGKRGEHELDLVSLG